MYGARQPGQYARGFFRRKIITITCDVIEGESTFVVWSAETAESKALSHDQMRELEKRVISPRS